MREHKKVIVRLIDEEYISNQRLVEGFANKYIERKLNNEI